MDHLKHFGLSEQPFHNDPNPDFHFACAEWTDAEQRVRRGPLQGKGLCVVVGALGCGKTTIARHLLEELDPEAFETSLLVLGSTGVEGSWLLSQVASQLGVVQPAANRVGMLGQIYDRLVHLHEAGRRAVVIVDDAHHLAGPEALSAVRALLNFEHEEQRLVTLVLVGLPELEETLRTDPALQQRVEIMVRVRPMSGASTEGYVAHRVRAAGGDPGCFEPEAVAALHRCGWGVPRLVNTLADNALFEAHLAGRGQVSPHDVERAATDLGIATTLVEEEPGAGHVTAGFGAAHADPPIETADDEFGL